MVMPAFPESEYRISRLLNSPFDSPAHGVRAIRHIVPYGLRRAGHDESWLNPARRELLDRDGPTCARCGQDAGDEVRNWQADSSWPFPLDIDHIVPLAEDGLHSLNNMQLLCRKCHTAKTNIERPPTKADKMAALEAAGWERRGAKDIIRAQWWRDPQGGRSYRLDVAWRIHQDRIGSEADSPKVSR